MALHILDHPVIEHKLSVIRKEETSTYTFRKIVEEISSLMVYEITRDFKLHVETIKTPVVECESRFLEGKK